MRRTCGQPLSSRARLLAVVFGATALVLALVPLSSQAGPERDLDGGAVSEAADQAKGLIGDTAGDARPGGEQGQAPGPASQPSGSTGSSGSGDAGAAQRQQQVDDPRARPPEHGTNPHGQGTVGVVDINPDPTRPYAADPTGGESGETVVVGRSRAEQQEDGTYRGRIVIAALLGNEILGVETGPGETRTGPLDAVQTGLLDAICDGSGDQICLSVLRADSATTDSGSTNSFSAANVQIGGPEGITAGVAESNASISEDETCQRASGDSSVANAGVGPLAVGAAGSSVSSTSCTDGTSSTERDSRVIEIGGEGLPLPASGCEDGTPDSRLELGPLLDAICNADEGAIGSVRAALSVFVLNTEQESLLGAITAASEARTVAPSADPGPGPDPLPAPDPDPDPDADPDADPDPTPGPPDEDSGVPGDRIADHRDPTAVVADRLPFTGAAVLPLLFVGLGLLLAGGLAERHGRGRTRLQRLKALRAAARR